LLAADGVANGVIAAAMSVTLRVRGEPHDQADGVARNWGRCSRVRRADRAIRAGTLMSGARMVAVVALAWNLEARVPAARVKLNVIAANSSGAWSLSLDPHWSAPSDLC
jgi:hypothetical protein